MSTVHHTPIAVSAPANASVTNTPLSQLDQAIEDQVAALADVLDGDTAFTQLRLGGTTTLTISSDAITPTRSRHLIDTQGAAATDDLKTIVAGVSEAGGVLCLQIVSSSRTVTVKHNDGAGNIMLAAGVDLTLSATTDLLMLIYDATTQKWIQPVSDYLFRVREWLTSTLTKTKRLRLPDAAVKDLGSNDEVALRLIPRADASRVMWVNPAGAGFAGVGTVALTTSGTLTALQSTNIPATRAVTGGAAGNAAGVRSTTFDYTSTIFDPTFIADMEAGDYVGNNARLYVGLTAATPANNDGPINGIMFRYSTVVGDTTLKGVMGNGTNQGEFTTGVTASGARKLRIRVDSATGTAYFQVDDAAEISLNQYMPTANLGFAMWLITTAAAAKTIHCGRMYIEDR